MREKLLKQGAGEKAPSRTEGLKLPGLQEEICLKVNPLLEIIPEEGALFDPREAGWVVADSWYSSCCF
jgi:hypothetical protein